MKLRTLPAVFLFLLTLSACSLPGRAISGANCLQGEWVMYNEDLNGMMIALIPVPGMYIPVGEFHMTFEGSNFVYYSEGYTLRLENPSGYQEADANFETEGTFSAENGVLVLSDMITIRDVTTWRAVIDGETAEVPGGTLLAAPDPGMGPYTCSDSTLTIHSVSGSGTNYDMIFTRQP